MKKDAKQLAATVYFSLENVNKYGFFQIFFPEPILLVSSFLCMKSGNWVYFFMTHRELWKMSSIVPFTFNIIVLLAAIIGRNNRVPAIQNTDTSTHFRIPLPNHNNFRLIDELIKGFLNGLAWMHSTNSRKTGSNSNTR